MLECGISRIWSVSAVVVVVVVIPSAAAESQTFTKQTRREVRRSTSTALFSFVSARLLSQD